jgi:hypothetical protein
MAKDRNTLTIRVPEELKERIEAIDKKQLFRRVDDIMARVPDRDVPGWDDPESNE